MVQEASNCANHLSSASVIANRMVSMMLNMPDHVLTDWLNSQSAQDTLTLFTAHGQLGEAINAASSIAQSVLAESGVEITIPTVDVRSVTEKLAATGRVLSYVDGVFSVTTPLPDPPPEPSVGSVADELIEQQEDAAVSADTTLEEY